MKKTNKVLVTGSAGFIGTHLMKALGDRGMGYDIKSWKGADINDPEMLKGAISTLRPLAIIHLAAISNMQEAEKDPEQALRTNIIGSFNVMRIAHKYNTRVILASSAAVEQPELSLYGTTKDCMEKLAEMFDNVTIARFYNVYGPGSKSVVNKFIKMIKAGKEIKLNGNTTRDYIYIDDLVEILLQAVEADELRKMVEIGTGRATSLNKLVSTIQKIVKKEAIMTIGKPINEIQWSKRSGWKYGDPKITLEQGIRRLI